MNSMQCLTMLCLDVGTAAAPKQQTKPAHRHEDKQASHRGAGDRRVSSGH